jgi:AraC family transcriptional regulator
MAASMAGATGYSPESALCIQALGSTTIRSSQTCGWTSILLDHHRLDPTYDAFDTLPTPDQTIVVMLSGEQEIEAFGNGTWRRALYRAGTIGMTPGGHVDRLRRRVRRGQGSFEKVNLYLPQRLLQEAAEEYRRAGQPMAARPLASLAFQDPLILQTVSALVRGMATGLPDLYAQSASCWLATHLLSAHASWLNDTTDRLRSRGLSARRVAIAREFMRAHFAEALTLDQLATAAGISKFHFTREFRKGAGTTPHAYLLRIRIEAACRLLTETDLHIKQIAAQCGFERSAALRSAFLHHRGMTPSQFRVLAAFDEAARGC